MARCPVQERLQYLRRVRQQVRSAASHGLGVFMRVADAWSATCAGGVA